MKIITWLKKNKVFALLLAFALVWVGQMVWASRVVNKTGPQVGTYPGLRETPSTDFQSLSSPAAELSSSEKSAADSQARVVITTSGLSLVSKNVEQLANQVVEKAEEIGGFLVSRRLSRPEEAPYAVVVVRVPADKLDEAMGYYKDNARRVVSEQVFGRDVTEEYEDIEEKLVTLRTTKRKLEDLLDQAAQVEDLLEVQRELINIQERIDRYVGRKEYLEESAQYSKIRVDISSDALALPYQPGGETFRPIVVFKKAVRSLVKFAYFLGRVIIWVVVFAVIWLPVVFIVKLIQRRRKDKKGKK